MIDPVIFSFKLFVWTITLRWYGVLVMFGAVVGAWIAGKEIRRRGENGEAIWDAMVWVLPLGIIGARLWYVVNNILGGSTYYTDNPAKIMNIPEGGLHFFGGLLFGAIALYFFLKNNKMDIWLFLDAIAPAALIGQALARPANFINQELYGQPTKLPWGIAT
jgi:phosphatidylglycerol:prolipoprotein diacylglycerol transferase